MLEALRDVGHILDLADGGTPEHRGALPRRVIFDGNTLQHQQRSENLPGPANSILKNLDHLKNIPRACERWLWLGIPHYIPAILSRYIPAERASPRCWQYRLVAELWLEILLERRVSFAARNFPQMPRQNIFFFAGSGEINSVRGRFIPEPHDTRHFRRAPLNSCVQDRSGPGDHLSSEDRGSLRSWFFRSDEKDQSPKQQRGETT